MDITVVDYGVGNLGAIPNMLKRLGATADVTSDPGRIERAEKLILPGVGAFDAAMGNLRELGLIEILDRQVQDRRVPILGLCLGMQILARSSEEGVLPGFGWIPGEVVRFKIDEAPGRSLTVPMMGWNYVRVVRPSPLVANLGSDPRFYFAHSYHLVCDDPDDVVGVTTYGYEFPSVVTRGNVMGAQFHPEKSHRFGIKVFENFLGI